MNLSKDVISLASKPYRLERETAHSKNFVFYSNEQKNGRRQSQIVIQSDGYPIFVPLCLLGTRQSNSVCKEDLDLMWVVPGLTLSRHH